MRAAAGLVMLLVLTLSGVLWTWAFAKLARKEPLLPLEPRRVAPWGLADLIIAIFLLFTMQIAAQAMLLRPQATIGSEKTLPDPKLLAMGLAVSASLQLLTMAISMLIVSKRTGASLIDMGFDLRKLAGDVRLGVIGFIMLAPPVYAIQLVLVQLFPQFHPLIEVLRKSPDGWLFLASGFAVTIGAPLTEEYFFRSLLQGWLETLRRGLSFDAILLGTRRDAEQAESITAILVEDSTTESSSVIAKDNPYASPSEISTAIESSDDLPRAVPRWPMYVSALLFALAHYSHGPAPIPLFLLALGLGYLYQRTHRLTPCITVHFLLNAWTMVLLLIEVYFPLS